MRKLKVIFYLEKKLNNLIPIFLKETITISFSGTNIWFGLTFLDLKRYLKAKSKNKNFQKKIKVVW
jgi:hypothetical protein